MEENTNSGEENYSTDDGLPLQRRDYLRLTTAAGVIGLGSSAFAGQVSAADEEPKRTLTIEGTGSRADYHFSVDGSIVKSTAMGASISNADEISGSSVTGNVGSGKDSYAFTGELTSFGMDGDAYLYLNGEPLSDTVTIEDNPGEEATHYELRVDGEVLKSTAMAATIDENDEITSRNHPDEIEPLTSAEPLAGETYALGQVNNWADSYSISGNITGFHADGSVNLYVNGELVENPARFVRPTLTLESTDGGRAEYEFSVSGDMSRSRAMNATLDDADEVNNGIATGLVSSGRDSYAFTGEITDFSSDDNLRVYLSGESINRSTLAADPKFENTLTLEGHGGKTTYHFAVEGDLGENYGLTEYEHPDSNVADGAVDSGQDSYTFSGDISTFTYDSEDNAEFQTYLNGNEVEPETLSKTQTTPDADQLPNEVSIRALTDARTEYGFGVSGTLATGDRSNTYSGDNSSYEYARGWVSGEGLDNYKNSGEIRTLTDFDTFQIDVDEDNGTISIEDFDSDDVTNYEIVVSGKMSTTSSSSESSASGGTATGAVANATDVFNYTGSIETILIENKLQISAQLRSMGTPVSENVAAKAAKQKMEAVSERSEFSSWKNATVGTPSTVHLKNAGEGMQYVRSARVFPVMSDDDSVGYVTIAPWRDWAPVLEYSTGTPPQEIANSTQEAAVQSEESPTGHVLYSGGVQYGVEMDDDTVWQVNGRQKQNSNGGAISTEFSYDRDSFGDQWDDIENADTSTSGDVTTNAVISPGDSDQVTGVPAWTEQDSGGATNTQIGPAFDSWADWDGCVPVAASMVIAYHEGISQDDNDAREAIIDRLHIDLDTQDDSGAATFPTRIDGGFDEYDYGSNSYNGRNIYKPAHPDFVKSEISDNDRPFLLNMTDGGTAEDRNQTYGNHTVTVVGYQYGGDELALHDTWGSGTHYLSWGSWLAHSYTKVTVE